MKSKAEVVSVVKFFRVVGNSTITVYGDSKVINNLYRENNQNSSIGYTMPNTHKHHIFFDYSDFSLFYKFLGDNIYRINCKKNDVIVVHVGNFEGRLLALCGLNALDKLYTIYNDTISGFTCSSTRIKFDRGFSTTFCTKTPTQYLRVSQYAQVYANVSKIYDKEYNATVSHFTEKSIFLGQS